jgi:hypothetical protein
MQVHLVSSSSTSRWRLVCVEFGSDTLLLLPDAMQLVLQRHLRVLQCGVLCLGVGVEAVPGAVSGTQNDSSALHQERPHLQQSPQRCGVNNCWSGRNSRA